MTVAPAVPNASVPPSIARPDTRSWYARNRLRVAPWLFLAPALIFFLIYVIAPIFQSIWYSFHAWDGLSPARWVGVDNYVELFDDDRFYTSLYNNVLWLALYMLAVPAGLFIALFLNQTVTGMRLYKSLFFFPFVISQVVVGLIFAWFYNPNFGIVGAVWEFFGASPPSILGDERYVTYGIIFAGLWPQVAYCMILYLTGLNNVSPDQVEAARLDNAKGFSMLWHIILPQLWPATFLAIVVTVIGALRSFDMIAVMTQGGPYGSSNVLSYFMYEQALSEYGFRMGYGSAIAAVLFAIMLVFISVFLWKMYRDERVDR
ncbi:sugar ABC transporter permease [Rhizobiaceae bacterium]|nr:sugar ABC transporter permease [Rhizobiaceae bacterium]